MKLADMKWPEVEALSRDTPIVFPIAAHEQHGHHMPLHTDSLLLGEITQRVEERMAEQIVLTPLQWFGNSHHHMDFPGTLSADPRLYIDLLKNQVECFLVHGFKRLILINGHGGNIVPGSQAVFELRQKHREETGLLLLSSTYWESAPPPGPESGLEQSAMGHAGEWETSMMLAIRPELVGDYQAEDTQEQGRAFRAASRGWTMKDRTPRGHIGSPQAATVEKGRALLERFTDGVQSLLEEVVRWDGKSWDPSL